MLSITYVMVRSAKGASRTTHGGRAAPGFRFETNSLTRSQAGTHACNECRPVPVLREEWVDLAEMLHEGGDVERPGKGPGGSAVLPPRTLRSLALARGEAG
jgi:hypothetical protein